VSNKSKKIEKEGPLPDPYPALLRAAERARKEARDTGTCIVIMQDGKIVRITPAPSG